MKQTVSWQKREVLSPIGWQKKSNMAKFASYPSTFKTQESNLKLRA